MIKNNKILTKITLKKLLIFSLIAPIIYLLIGALFTHIVINISDSHRGTIFWKSDKSPVKNNFVYFDFKHKLLPQNIDILSKKLVCIESDNLVINDNFIICNEKKYPIKRNQKTGSGKSIKQFYYEGTVPKNQAVVWGSNLESFDSRYWGFIEYRQLKTMLLLL
ncbi:hypothetical protein [uncultured Gammaproteobacteria bacterium]|jgi:type IV secretory pathway protease TraF|uniref:Uncharacterized protein n=1 Tax=Bathymodiolus azoricus thioautotrophic gill symbiont TaxID=235205 RepID=A0ACA8ZPI4_9GAMM|nr:hypothetical protein AZO1586R_931 [Bathymodiolus azoricus thioautotrophic gill symbiont]CAC9546216.1 hypothetical protein [uncultured Gammaproteobacteria bacterium]VVH58319.1 hypothetical protein BAZOLSSOX_876 [uncultured Gammaproteobacteria bacterium]